MTAGTKMLINERDQKILDLGDDNFVPFTWEDLVDIVETNTLVRLSRRPSDLKVYLEEKHRYEQNYGGILQFIIKEKLKWTPSESGEIIPSSTTFLGSKDDVKVLRNDFPYGVEDGIVHLVVWSKARIPQDTEGHLDPSARITIEKYVQSTFVKLLGFSRADILWFKNWGALQSVRALEHFHVLIRNPPMSKLESIIGTSGSLETTV